MPFREYPQGGFLYGKALIDAFSGDHLTTGGYSTAENNQLAPPRPPEKRSDGLVGHAISAQIQEARGTAEALAGS